MKVAKPPSTLLFSGIDRRITLDRENGDPGYFQSLSLKLEYVTKLVACGILACIGDDADRHRYNIEHKLIRADSMGDWVNALDAALIGPTAQFVQTEARIFQKELTQRATKDDWRYCAVKEVMQAAQAVGVQTALGPKVALRRFFDVATQLRNRSRAHGATTSLQFTQSCPHLAVALGALVHGLALFKVPWAYLHRNLNGKYRVSPLLSDCSRFDYLKSSTDTQIPNGVYLYLDRPIRVPFVYSDPNVNDIFLANGNYDRDEFEVLSYVTNELQRESGTQWSAPPGPLPRSETEGSSQLDDFGFAWANVPYQRGDYVPRSDLEEQLMRELLVSDRHAIVSLTGPGGIGKTSVAIASLHAMKDLDHHHYEAILWISARDIDLLESGPKPVAPRVVTLEDIAQAVVQLVGPPERSTNTFDAVTYLQRYLADGQCGLGPTLFVLDNFETVQSPADVYSWLDTHVRPPNKILVTTRIRVFVGDYQIKIGGMTDTQAGVLVDQHAIRLGVHNLVNSDFKNKLITESDGHPYVIRILLGQVSRERRLVTPERIVANSEHILRALFERTFATLGPGTQRVFLLLCSWRVLVPEVAIEAVSLRTGSERFDVSGSIDELESYSLVDRFFSNEGEGENLVGVPLAAAMYGRGKLEASPFSVIVEADRKLLMEFGPGKPKDPSQSVLPRIEALYQSVERSANSQPQSFEELRPVLEYLAMRVPRAYLRLADLVVKVGSSNGSSDDAKEYLRRFIETASAPDKRSAWLRLADLCKASNDIKGEIHALSERARLLTANPEELGDIANRLNSTIRGFKVQSIEDAWSPEVAAHLDRVTQLMERHLSRMDATTCSRLAWLYLNIGRADRARDVAEAGILRDRENEHCLNLIWKLDQESGFKSEY